MNKKIQMIFCIIHMNKVNMFKYFQKYILEPVSIDYFYRSCYPPSYPDGTPLTTHVGVPFQKFKGGYHLDRRG